LEFNQVMGPQPEYPFGEIPYFAGYHIVDELQHEMGLEGAKATVYAGASRLTWFLNGTLESARDELVERGRKVQDPTGELLWRNVWQKAVERLQAEHAPEFAELDRSGVGAPETLTPEGAVAQGARLSPDDKALAYAYHSGHDLSGLRVKWLATGKETVIESRGQVFPEVSWSADGKALYFSKADYDSPYRIYGDLYVARASDGATQALTSGARAKDPTVCGKYIVFTQVIAGGSQLAALNEGTGRIHTLYTPPAGSRVSNPRCALGGDATVYFSEHGREPKDGIYAVDLDGTGHAAGAPRHIIGGPQAEFGAIFPEPTVAGPLYFTRVKNGFYELARLQGGRITAI
jgi:hypothetical protein